MSLYKNILTGEALRREQAYLFIQKSSRQANGHRLPIESAPWSQTLNLK